MNKKLALEYFFGRTGMKFEFKKKDIAKLAQVLEIKPKQVGTSVRFEIENKEQRRKLAVEIYSNIDIGNRKGNLISVYTRTAHLQLHFCTGYVISKMLGEITFVGESEGKLSGLTIEREGGCSLYANVDRNILSGDFTKLGPEVMLSGIALSLTESILPPTSQKKIAVPVRGRSLKRR
jgi:hypothetical protein